MSRYFDAEGTRLANAYNNGDKSVIRYQTGTTSFRVGPDGRGSRPAYGYMRKPAPAAPAPAAAPARAPKPKPKPKPKAKEEPKAPIEYSPEIQQAKERVQAYEADILSGKTSDDIYSYDNDYSKDTYIAQPSGANIDYSFDAALAKALMASGLMLPAQGTVLFSIADRDKPEALPIIRKLASLNYKLYATEGTAAMIEAVGLPVKITSKKLSEGHPNIVDMIHNGEISGVVNTITGDHVPLRDGFQIRRAAAEKRIPCFTNLDTIRAAVEALANGVQAYTTQPLPDYRTKPS